MVNIVKTAATGKANYETGFGGAAAGEKYDKNLGAFLGIGSVSGSLMSSNYGDAQKRADGDKWFDNLKSAAQVRG